MSESQVESQPNQPIMAICTDGNRCGCAIYIDSSVQLVADRKDSGDPYKGLDIIIQKIDPVVVIVSSVQKRLITFIEKRFKIKLAIVPNIFFSMSKGLQKLLDSELVKSKGYTEPEEKLLFISSKVERSVDVCAIRAVAALDNYIMERFLKQPDVEQEVPTNLAIENSVTQQIRSLQATSQLTCVSQVSTMTESRNANNLMPILEIKYVDPGPVLSIDRFTIEALGIFHQVDKNSYNVETGGEQDSEVEVIPSLFDVLNQCHSAQGKRQLRTMMMWPLQEITELDHRHDILEYFLMPEHKLLRDQLGIQLKNVVPLTGIMTKLSHSVGSYKEMAIVYKALWSFIAIIDLIHANPGHNLEIFNRILNLDSPDLRAVVDSIMNIVDFEASKKERRIQICFGVDQNVDEKKEIVKNLMQFCDEIAIQETVKYKDTIAKQFRILYIPRIGFLSSINYTSTTELLQMRSSREFDVLLFTEQSVYFKTPRMEELDNNAGDIACDLIDVQENVVVNLQNELLKHTETILRLMELCGELDCLLAFAIVSFQRGYTRPVFTADDEEIYIKQAYHPLHCIRFNIVPNDVNFYKASSERRVKVMVLTGPNSSGKTTYMKATCLVVYMAHIGCFVPAMQARMPIVDAILTRMHSANSISTGLSAFATDLHQINYALNRATGKSLIAIDEFGKGTQACDGFHLLKGLITYFVTRGQKSPYVMAATHFNRLINHLQNYSEYILYKTFKVTRDPTKDSIVYEFKMIDGVGEVSLADKVAARAGVPQRIIERANQLRDCMIEGRAIRPRPPCGA